MVFHQSYERLRNKSNKNPSILFYRVLDSWTVIIATLKPNAQAN